MKKILVVDDIPKMRKVVKTTLAKKGYEVIEASDGIEAVDIIDRDNIDLVIMDVVMPQFGGISSLAGFKEIFKQTKVIFMTGKYREDSEEFRTLARDLGALHVLFKPFKKTELLSIVGEILA
ncbi:MAG: response regulator [Spirochaetales bacterium]|nr:response regulator [Spirochaetales bacterium]